MQPVGELLGGTSRTPSSSGLVPDPNPPADSPTAETAPPDAEQTKYPDGEPAS